MPTPDFSTKGSIVRREVKTEGGVLGLGGTRHEVVQFENGEIWDFPDNGEPKYGGLDDAAAKQWNERQKRENAPPDAVTASPSNPYIVSRDAQGQLQKEPNPNYMPPSQSSAQGSPISAPSSQRTILMQYDDGTRSEIPNPNYVNPQAQPDVRQVGNSVIQRNPTTGQWDVVYTAPREPTGQLTEYQKWQIANYGSEQEYARGRDSVADLQKQQEREAENLRNNATNYTSAWREALKYRTAPGVEYIPSFEPGGLQEQLQRRRGYNYNADPWRTTMEQFDPWRAALDTYK